MNKKRIRTSSDIYNKRTSEYWNNAVIKKNAPLTADEFKKVDNELCNIMKLKDEIDFHLEPIICFHCNGAGDCECEGGNIKHQWHRGMGKAGGYIRKIK